VNEDDFEHARRQFLDAGMCDRAARYAAFGVVSLSTGVAGATAIGYYHLRAGDAITPGVLTQNTAAGSINTSVSAGRQSHFEVVYIGE